VRPFYFIFALIMKRILFISLAILTALTACTKTEKTRTSGTDTIDNTTYQSTTYFVYGFSFSNAKLVSTINNSGYDIVVYVNKDDPDNSRLTLQTNNRLPSFYKVGDFTDEASAKTAFDNLKTVSVSEWEDMADPIADNQVWIYRTGNECYVKIRIVSTVNEIRNTLSYGECTFQWLYQPDGSTTFSEK
jgi:hypothetical protein